MRLFRDALALSPRPHPAGLRLTQRELKTSSAMLAGNLSSRNLVFDIHCRLYR